MKAPLLFLTVFLFGTAFAETEYRNHPPAGKKTRAMWRGARRIMGPEVKVWLDWPSAPVLPKLAPPQVPTPSPDAQPDSPPPPAPPRSVTIQLSLKDASHAPLSSWEETYRVSYQGVIREQKELSLAIPHDLPDGLYTLSAEGEEFLEGKLPEPLVLHNVTAALTQIDPAHREEMTSWVQEGNHERLIWGKQPLWPNVEKALKTPTDPFKDLTGFLIRSYESPHLRRRQPYTVYVPKALDLSEPAPLMILLHGSGGDYRNLVADYAAGQRFEEFPMLIANAGAYKNTEFRHMVLEDVRSIIEDMQIKYNVDPDRIYAQGISLGGRGVLELSALMPDMFAAVSSQGTYGVHHEWMDPLFAMHRDPVAFQLAARSDIRTWMPNLATTPVEMAFGWQDTSTRPVGALAIAIQLQRLRYNVVERGFDMGHNITLPDYDWATTRKWFLEQTKERWPRRIRFRVSNLRYNRFSWIRVEALHDPSGIGEVEAMVTKDGVQFKVRNIARLTVIPPPEEEAGFTLEAQTVGFDRMGRLMEPPPDLNGHVGPLWDIFSEPVLVVVDPTVEETPLFSVEKIRTSYTRTDATPAFHFPALKGDELTEEQRRGHNLIVFTTRDSDWDWKKRLQVQLPDKVQEMREGEDTLMAIRSSPWSSRHKVLIVEAGSENPLLLNPYRIGLFQEPLQADWLLLSRGRQIKAAGSFHGDGRPGPWTPANFFTRVITR